MHSSMGYAPPMSGFVVVWRRAGAGLLVSLAIACGPREARPTTTKPDPSSASAVEPALRIDRERLQAGLDEYLGSFGSEWGPTFRFSGFVLVTQGDEVIYERGFGHADLQAGRVPDIDTSFRVGSVTKQFTAAAILRLREQGKLEVTDTVGKHLPHLPAPLADVTIHQLLTHTAGVWSYTSDPKLMERRAEPRTVEQMLEWFSDRPLDFTPGSEFRYSNSGYIVLGAIIEAASGMPYGDYLERELFGPAGMTRTQYGDHEGLDNRAIGYQRTPMETLDEAGAIHMSVPYAAGGIRSTARDLWRWHQALSGDAILGEASRALLYTVDKADYAYGWGVQDHEGHRVIAHGGGIDGFICDYRRLVDDDVMLVAWTNSGPEAAMVAAAFLPLVTGKEPPPPTTELEPATFDPEIGPTVAGTYALSDTGSADLKKAGIPDEIIATFERLEIGYDDRSLTFKPTGQDELRLHAKGDGSWFSKQPQPQQVTVTFEVAEGAEQAGAFQARQGPMKVRYERVPDPKPPKKAKRK